MLGDFAVYTVRDSLFVFLLPVVTTFALLGQVKAAMVATGPLSVLMRVAGLGYHGPSSEDAWTRILRFFDEHLRGSSASS